MEKESYAQFKKRLLKDPQVKVAYDALETEYALASVLIKARLEKGITQAELAKKLGTKQSAISRLESGESNPSVGFLEKVAKALGVRLEIRFS